MGNDLYLLIADILISPVAEWMKAYEEAILIARLETGQLVTLPDDGVITNYGLDILCELSYEGDGDTFTLAFYNEELVGVR